MILSKRRLHGVVPIHPPVRRYAIRLTDYPTFAPGTRFVARAAAFLLTALLSLLFFPSIAAEAMAREPLRLAVSGGGGGQSGFGVTRGTIVWRGRFETGIVKGVAVSLATSHAHRPWKDYTAYLGTAGLGVVWRPWRGLWAQINGGAAWQLVLKRPRWRSTTTGGFLDVATGWDQALCSWLTVGPELFTTTYLVGGAYYQGYGAGIAAGLTW